MSQQKIVSFEIQSMYEDSIILPNVGRSGKFKYCENNLINQFDTKNDLG